jgi:hypothetical protein
LLEKRVPIIRQYIHLSIRKIGEEILVLGRPRPRGFFPKQRPPENTRRP